VSTVLVLGSSLVLVLLLGAVLVLGTVLVVVSRAVLAVVVVLDLLGALGDEVAHLSASVARTPGTP